MKRVWLALCVVGTVVPYSVFLPWLVENGLDIGLLIDEATSSPIAAFAWLDILVAAVVVLVLAGCRIGQGERRYWLAVAGTCLVGVSLGLPLYLYLRDATASAPRAV